MYGSVLRSTTAPASTSRSGRPCVTSMTRTSGASRAMTRAAHAGEVVGVAVVAEEADGPVHAANLRRSPARRNSGEDVRIEAPSAHRARRLTCWRTDRHHPCESHGRHLGAPGRARLAVAAVGRPPIAQPVVGGQSRSDRALRRVSPSPPVPAWRLTSYRKVGFDRSFKADLIDELPDAAAAGHVRRLARHAVRARRTSLTNAGLSGLELRSVQSCRPDGRLGVQRTTSTRAAPDVKLHCVIAVQTRDVRTTTTLHPGPAVRQAPGVGVPAGAGRSGRKRSLGKPKIKERASAATAITRKAASSCATRYDVAPRAAGLLLHPAPWTATSGGCSPEHTLDRPDNGRCGRADRTSRRPCGSTTRTTSRR